jgi:YHS domain-containing protein
MRRHILVILVVLTIATALSSAGAQGRRGLRPEKVKDPVCGLMVDKDPNLATTFKGEVYFFCSRTDLDLFKKNPERYLRK